MGWCFASASVAPAAARAAKSPPGGSAGRAVAEDRNRSVSSGQRGANLVGDGLERGWIGPGDVGKHLAVHLDPGLGKAVNKSGVGEAFQARRRVDALDPQRPERALADPAVAVGVLAGLVDRGLGGADGVLAAAPEALGLLEDLLVLGVGDDAPFHACHVSSAPYGRPLGR